MASTRPRVLAVVLAGGKGSRMGVLTERRAKPVLPFAGVYRLIDFALSNCANSGITDVWVAEQYQPHALEDHLSNGRPWDLDRTAGGLLILHPFTGGDEGGFHHGNADVLWHHRTLIRQFDPDVVLVLSADAVYTADYRDLVEAHLARDADVTMLTTCVEGDASRFGVVDVDGGGRVTRFWYKPEDPPTREVSMEVFAYRPAALLDTLEALAGAQDELADFGDGLVPDLVDRGRAYAHRFDGYWRDVGTPESYWQAHQDLLDGVTGTDFDDPDWPVRTEARRRRPAFVARGATVEDSLVAPACVVEGTVVRSVLGRGVVVEKGAVVDHAVVLDGAVVRAGAVVERAVVDLGADLSGRVGPDGGEIVVVGRSG